MTGYPVLEKRITYDSNACDLISHNVLERSITMGLFGGEVGEHTVLIIEQIRESFTGNATQIGLNLRYNRGDGRVPTTRASYLSEAAVLPR